MRGAGSGPGVRDLSSEVGRAESVAESQVAIMTQRSLATMFTKDGSTFVTNQGVRRRW